MKVPLCGHMGSGPRFFVPDLPAHGDEASAPYVSVVAEATVIHQWLVSNGMSYPSPGFAASLGGVILFELLCFSDFSFDRLLIEGASLYLGGPVVQVGGAVLSRVMVVKHRKAVCDPEAGARGLQCLYGEEAARSTAASFATTSEDSIRAIVHDCSRVDLPPLSPAIQWHCVSTYGEKDLDLRPACRMIPRLYPGAELRVWPDWGHCRRMSRDSITHGVMPRNIALGSVSIDCS